MRIFAGNSNRQLAESIAQSLDTRLGEMVCARFPDGEVKVQVQEDVRGSDVFIVQSTHTNEFLMELLVIVDAMRRSSDRRITAVMPSFGSARQDRKDQGRVPITAKLVANLLVTAGVQRVLTIDLHAPQIQGFFDIPVDHLSAMPVLLDYLQGKQLKDPVVLSPDTGSIKLADRVARSIGGGLAIIDKRRIGDSATSVANVIGEIADCDVIIADDMISTAGSMTNAVKVARDRGARTVIPMASHGLLCGNAYDRLSGSDLNELVLSDTVPLKRRFADLPVTVLSVASLLGEAIHRIHTNKSVSSLIR
jgi:ribose-phosphate pyrophosphokinase